MMTSSAPMRRVLSTMPTLSDRTSAEAQASVSASYASYDHGLPRPEIADDHYQDSYGPGDVEMDEARTTRQLNLYRNLGLAMTFLALVGWGTAYFADASSAVQLKLHEEVSQLKAEQDQLTAERDQAQTQLGAAQKEVAGLTERIEKLQEKVSVTGSVPPPTPASKPTRTPAKKDKGR